MSRFGFLLTCGSLVGGVLGVFGDLVLNLPFRGAEVGQACTWSARNILSNFNCWKFLRNNRYDGRYTSI